MDRSMVIAWSIVGAIAIVPFAYDRLRPIECTGASPITKIVSLDYRVATLQLQNGMVIKTHQDTLKPGNAFCYHHERK